MYNVLKYKISMLCEKESNNGKNLPESGALFI